MTKFSVPDMTCGHCTATIETALKGLDANAALKFDLDTHTVEVDSGTAVEPIIAAMKEAGYEATVTG